MGSVRLCGSPSSDGPRFLSDLPDFVSRSPPPGWSPAFISTWSERTDAFARGSRAVSAPHLRAPLHPGCAQSVPTPAGRVSVQTRVPWASAAQVRGAWAQWGPPVTGFSLGGRGWGVVLRPSETHPSEPRGRGRCPRTSRGAEWALLPWDLRSVGSSGVHSPGNDRTGRAVTRAPRQWHSCRCLSSGQQQGVT